MFKIASTAAVLLATTAGAVIVGAGPAAAAPGAPWTDGQVMEMRLAIGGVNHQSQPDLVATADTVCAILRTDPTVDGKTAARAYLVSVGYPSGFPEGYALGTMVDVRCRDMIPVIR